MSQEMQKWIQLLETEWAMPGGFLGKVREGNFDPEQGAKFVTKLQSVRLDAQVSIERRLVALIWYIPLFLSWQRDRISQEGGDVVAFEQFTNRVQSVVEEILGVP